MRVTRLERVKSLLVLGAVLIPAVLAGGCGSTTTGGPEQGFGALAEEYEAILADRYDELFPDDRVQTVRILMDDADWQSMQGAVRSKEYFKADIWIDDELVQDVAVRTKGSSSLMFATSAGSFRAGLKVDFNFFNSARSYHGIKKLAYNNGFSDPTLMKEFLGYELMALMGVPTPRACFVDVWVNDAHLGVYTQVEAVDGRFLSENFADDGGNLYKPEIKAGALDWTEADVAAEATSTSAAPAGSTTTTTPSFNLGGGDFAEIVDRLGEDAGWIPGRTDTTEDAGNSAGGDGPAQAGGLPGGPVGPGVFMDFDADYLTSMGLRSNENSPDYSGLYELLALLNSDPAQVSKDDLEDIMQVDEVLRFLAVSVALVHLDNYMGMGHNYYLYEDGGRFWIIPWDLNMSFGGFPSGLSEQQILGFYIDEPTAGAVDEYPLVEQLIDEPEYLAIYRGYLEQLIEGPFSVERMTARSNEIADVIRPYVEKDDRKFYTSAEFEQGLTQSLSNAQVDRRAMGGSFIGLAYFVQQRVASIAAQLSGESPASMSDGSGNGGAKGLAGLMGRGRQPGGVPGAAPGGGGALPGAGPTSGVTVPDGAIPPAGTAPEGP